MIEGRHRWAEMPLAMAQNLAMRVPAVRRAAVRRHRTGVMDDPSQARRALAELTAHLGELRLEGADVLELGPGQGTGLIRAAQAEGARCAAFDVTAYLSADVVADLGVDYRTDPGGTLPWPDGAFDVVWSYSVLEHVRDPAATLREVRRVLRPGGRHVALIDLESHLGGRRDPERMYEFLRHPGWRWDLVASHRSSWVNRLRLSEWRPLFRAAGLEVDHEEPTCSELPLSEFRAVPYLRGLPAEDVLTRRVVITSRRAG